MKNFNPKTQIAIIWSIEDVQSIRQELSDAQAMEVLQSVERHHDCTIGITWETFEIVAEDLFGVPPTRICQSCNEVFTTDDEDWCEKQGLCWECIAEIEVG